VPRRLDTTRWWFQVAVVIGVYEIYRLARIAVRGSPSASLRHARQVVRAERSTHLYFERRTQQLLIPHEWLIRFFDAYHGIAHFIAVGATLAILWRFDRPRYRFWRNVFGWVLLIGLIGFALYPVTPPRLMPSAYGFVDAARKIGGLGPVGADKGTGGGGNEFACVPSLHAAWSLWVVLALWPLARRWWLKALLIAHLIVMHVTIIATGKHWVVDAPAGWIALGLAILIEAGRQRWRRAEGPESPSGSGTVVTVGDVEAR
jgi:PAP2 superfamily